MSATVTIAKALSNEKTININSVDKEAQDKYICTGCGQQLIPVKTIARKKDWHFRHPQYFDIAK